MILSTVKDASSLVGTEGLITWNSLLAGGTAVWLAVFAYQVHSFNRSHRLRNYGQIPPKYPTLIPYLGVVIPLLWDTRSALTHLTLVLLEHQNKSARS